MSNCGNLESAMYDELLAVR